jgi:hypothetical protein
MAPFPYYRKLSARNKAIYRASDAIGEVSLGNAVRFAPVIAALRRALEQGDPRDVQEAASRLCLAIATVLRIEPLTVKVLARRPSNASGELHGLYVREQGRPAVIRVWYRTAQQRRVVAFRTFLRTLLHEVGHHLDFTMYRWPESFHTEGFFRRESSLVRQLLPKEERRRRRTDAKAAGGETARDGSATSAAEAPVSPAVRRRRTPAKPTAEAPEAPAVRSVIAEKPANAPPRSAPAAAGGKRRPKPPEQMSLFPEEQEDEPEHLAPAGAAPG